MAGRERAVTTLPKLITSLRKLPPKPKTTSYQQTLPSLRRAFSLYDQINVIDNVPDDQLRFQRYTDTGFTVNGVEYEGSLLCVGNLLMSWAPKKFSEITPDSLSIVKVVRPIPAKYPRGKLEWRWSKGFYCRGSGRKEKKGGEYSCTPLVEPKQNKTPLEI